MLHVIEKKLPQNYIEKKMLKFWKLTDGWANTALIQLPLAQDNNTFKTLLFWSFLMKL